MTRKRSNSPKQSVHEAVHYMTPVGYKMLADEQDHLIHVERPRICDIVSWAAGNGDRSENGDYIYNKKRLREIDGRLRYLKKKLDNVKIVDPKDQQNLDKVYFGATVTYVREDDCEVTIHLVGVDEADFEAGKVNWLSPIGKALMKAEKGDIVRVGTESGVEDIEVVDIHYHLSDVND